MQHWTSGECWLNFLGLLTKNEHMLVVLVLWESSRRVDEWSFQTILVLVVQVECVLSVHWMRLECALSVYCACLECALSVSCIVDECSFQTWAAHTNRVLTVVRSSRFCFCCDWQMTTGVATSVFATSVACLWAPKTRLSLWSVKSNWKLTTTTCWAAQKAWNVQC